MISELKIRNFKSLESVDLKLGHFNLLVGANASGKSNFLDALRFLQGVGNGLSITEILEGKSAATTNSKWPGIRGGSQFITWRRPNGSRADSIVFSTTFSEVNPPDSSVHELIHQFTCSVANGSAYISRETLNSGANILIDEDQRFSILPLTFRQTDDDAVVPEVSFDDSAFDDSAFDDSAGTDIVPDQSRSVLATLSSVGKILGVRQGLAHLATPIWCAVYVASNLTQIQFLDPLPAMLREYSAKATQLGENGEGFAALIHEIESNGSKPALLEWLKELRPDEVDDIYALEGLNNDFMVAIKEGNKEFRGPVLSEGTLRFIALAAAFFQPSMPKVLVIEEIERGLHPSRLRLLLELMRSQSRRTGTQVFATTHSPTLLAWLTEEDRKTTFVCTRDAESGATRMRSLAEVPRLEELVRERHSLDQLFEQGWIESVLHES